MLRFFMAQNVSAPFPHLFPRIMSQVPCLHGHKANDSDLADAAGAWFKRREYERKNQLEGTSFFNVKGFYAGGDHVFAGSFG
jgi:hypothetical protein